MADSPNSVTFSSGAIARLAAAPDRLVVTVTGELDACFAPSGAALRKLLAAQDLPVDLDLSGLTFFSAAGVSWLVSLYTQVPSGVRLVAASEAVLEVLDVCGVPAPLVPTGGGTWDVPR